MFDCCQGSMSPEDIQKNSLHLNPIHRRMATRKNSSKSKKSETKTDDQFRNKTPTIQESDFANNVPTLKMEEKTQSVRPFDMPNSHSNLSSLVTRFHLVSRNTLRTNQVQQIQLENVQLKYSHLQSKYIGVLQRNNHLLQKQLGKSHLVSQEESMIKSERAKSAKRQITSQLYDLKRRLNNIDLSGVKKIAYSTPKPEKVSHQKLKTMRLGNC